jgi:hypothetical protein
MVKYHRGLFFYPLSGSLGQQRKILVEEFLRYIAGRKKLPI